MIVHTNVWFGLEYFIDLKHGCSIYCNNEDKVVYYWFTKMTKLILELKCGFLN